MTATRLHDRALVRLSTADAAEDIPAFLQGLVTSDVTGDLPVYAALLTPQGKMMFDFFVWPAGVNEVLLDCEAEAAGRSGQAPLALPSAPQDRHCP